MRKGLTLMELLTVISILATLAALLFPIYLKVRSRVYETSCANQLKQIGLAVKMYVEEQGDGTPYSIPGPHIGLGLYPYIRNKDIFVCPYFKVLFPGVAEKRHQRWHPAWNSYFFITPRSIDEAAREGDSVCTVAEVFAKRGDQMPVGYCGVHRNGCDSSIPGPPPGFEWIDCHKLYFPVQPLVVLRWGGNIDFVYKGGYSVPTDIFLIDY